MDGGRVKRAVRYLTSPLFLFALAACTQLPNADYAALRSGDSADPAAHEYYLASQEEQATGRRFLPDNKVTLLRDGLQAYPAMIAAIHAAKHRIDIESFLFDQKEGEQFADALLERARHGVSVNLIYDSYGSDDTPGDLFQRMQDGGIRVVEYNPIDPVSVLDTSVNYRDHRKVLIVDDRVAFTGGINISAVYKIRHPHKHFVDDLDVEHTPWRDTQVRIEGPAVQTFEDLFVETWRDQDGPPINAMQDDLVPHAGRDRVQIIDSYPTKDRFSIYQSVMMAIALAQKSVHLTTAYFVPPYDMVQALEDAARRGVEVTLLLPHQSDSDMALEAGHASYAGLMEAGVHIYERDDAILHAKTAVIDGIWSTVGSSNLDWRSAALNSECNAVILGTAFGNQMEAMFQIDLSRSHLIDPAVWEERSWFERLHEQSATIMEYFL
jgi:cardiolipin synthase